VETYPLLVAAARAASDAVSKIGPEQFAAPTPCAKFDVRTLANHLIWSMHLSRHAARKQPMPGDLTESRDYTAEGWPAVFTTTLDDLVRAWAEPGAWEGETAFGETPIPSAFAAELSWSDLVVHTWDLAVATGERLDVPADLAEATVRVIAGMAQLGRDMGFYGPEVPLPESAPALDRALGLTGRDPAWSPPGH